MPLNTEIYDKHAQEKFKKYESILSDDIYSWLRNEIPRGTKSALDIGAGSGRDASWLAENVVNVIAVEPSTPLRTLAKNSHRKLNIRWVDDCLPKLASLTSQKCRFDIILVSSVWTHVPHWERNEAFYRIASLLKPDGIFVLTYRIDGGRNRDDIYSISLEEIKHLAQIYGLEVKSELGPLEDLLERNDVAWIHMAFRSPKKQDEKVPLLQRIISGKKNGTHKLALLRTLCRIDSAQKEVIRENGEIFVLIPAGLVALIWNKLYIPLFREELPQRSTNIAFKDVDFATERFIELVNSPEIELKIDSVYGGDKASIIHDTISSSISAIYKSPRQYIKYGNDNPAFRFEGRRFGKPPYEIRLDTEYFSRFGYFLVPTHIWTAYQHFSQFIERDIELEWFATIKHYFEHQLKLGKRDMQSIASDEVIRNALVWRD